jgi:hypothetical protein
VILAVAGALLAAGWMRFTASEPAESGDWPAAPPRLVDPTRVLPGNLGQQVRYMAPYVLENGAVLLDRLLMDPKQPVIWTSAGQTIEAGRLTVPTPADHHAGVYRIEASASTGVRDVFTLVVIPESTSRHFAEWLRTEQRDLDWLRDLPPVYTALLPGGLNPEPETCSPRLWPVLRRVNGNYHPGAAYEMRSAIQPDGSGHQATYDAAGNLLRDSPAAGSADRAAPRSYHPLRLLAHRDRDVLPYIWAAQLDGNPVNPKPFHVDFDAPLLREGDHLRAYRSVRPSFHATRKELPPGVCAQ